jgi:hypothetical protein
LQLIHELVALVEPRVIQIASLLHQTVSVRYGDGWFRICFRLFPRAMVPRQYFIGHLVDCLMQLLLLHVARVSTRACRAVHVAAHLDESGAGATSNAGLTLWGLCRSPCTIECSAALHCAFLCSCFARPVELPAHSMAALLLRLLGISHCG